MHRRCIAGAVVCGAIFLAGCEAQSETAAASATADGGAKPIPIAPATTDDEATEAAGRAAAQAAAAAPDLSWKPSPDEWMTYPGEFHAGEAPRDPPAFSYGLVRQGEDRWAVVKGRVVTEIVPDPVMDEGDEPSGVRVSFLDPTTSEPIDANIINVLGVTAGEVQMATVEARTPRSDTVVAEAFVTMGPESLTVRVRRAVAGPGNVPVCVMTIEHGGRAQALAEGMYFDEYSCPTEPPPGPDGTSLTFSDGLVQSLFAGDLDRDGHIDLLLRYYTHYNTQSSGLYLSSRARAGKFVGLVVQIDTTGC